MKLNGHQEHKPMKKHLQQCYVCTKAGACSVAQDVGTDCVLSASSYSSEGTSAMSTDVQQALLEHAGSSDSQLGDMITDGTCSCFTLILEACFLGSSQNVENNYVVNAEILLQCL